MSRVYKYRGGRGILDKDGASIFERDVATLVNNQLYLPTKDGLNDPTEGCMEIMRCECAKYSHYIKEPIREFIY